MGGRRLPARRRRGITGRARRVPARCASTRCRRTRTRRSRSSSVTERSGEMLETVLGERGGAPLHYLLAYLAGLVDPGLTSLRLISVAFAVASVPVIAALVARLTDRRTALLATLSSPRRAGRPSTTASTGGCTASSCSRARSPFCSSSARSSGARAVAGRPGRRRRSRSSPRSPTACSSSARRLRTSRCSASGGRCRCARR